MASAFQMQARAAQLQRTSELAGEAFGYGLEADAPPEAAAPATGMRWAGVLAGAGLFLLAIVLYSV